MIKKDIMLVNSQKFQETGQKISCSLGNLHIDDYWSISFAMYLLYLGFYLFLGSTDGGYDWLQQWCQHNDTHICS